MKTLLVIVSLAALAGCSSSPKKIASQFCYTSQEVRVKNNETVSSETVVSCNDDPVERIPIKKIGVAKQCFESPYKHQLPSGRMIQGMGYACQKFDGTWEIIDGRGIN
jgi:hypothetical protein